MNTATKPESLALATVGQQQASMPVAHIGGQALTLDSTHLNNMMAVANMMASARATVPSHFRGNPGDCLAVVMQAARWGMDPFAVAQKTHLVQNTLGYEAQLVASVVNSSNITKDRMHFEWFGTWDKIIGKFKKVESKTKQGDDGRPKTYIVPDWDIKDEQGLGVRVWATLRGEDAPRELTLLMTQARTRNSGLWTEDPKQQLAYLAQKRWARLYAPDVLLGVYTPDELYEAQPKFMGAADLVPTNTGPTVPPELLKQAEDAAANGLQAYKEFWKATGAENRKILDAEHDRLKGIAQDADKARTVDNAAPAVDASTTQAAGGPKVTYAIVMDKLLAAKNRDALDVAADWIGEVDDPVQRRELSAKYDELVAKFGG